MEEGVCSTDTVSRQEELRPSGANNSFLLCSQEHKVYAVISSFFFCPYSLTSRKYAQVTA